MVKDMRRFGAVLVFVVIMALVAGCGQDKLPVIKSAPAFEMQNVDNTTVSLASTAGKVRLLYFYYSNCSEICLPTNGILAKLQTELKKRGGFGSKTALLSISIDPTNDTQARLKVYAAGLHADLTGWYFLRPVDFKSVQKLAGRYSVSVTALDGGEFIHTNALTLVDGAGKIRKIYTSKDIQASHVKAIADDMIGLTKE
jgi:protein SCO1/2